MAGRRIGRIQKTKTGGGAVPFAVRRSQGGWSDMESTGQLPLPRSTRPAQAATAFPDSSRSGAGRRVGPDTFSRRCTDRNPSRSARTAAEPTTGCQGRRPAHPRAAGQLNGYSIQKSGSRPVLASVSLPARCGDVSGTGGGRARSTHYSPGRLFANRPVTTSAAACLLEAGTAMAAPRAGWRLLPGRADHFSQILRTALRRCDDLDLG
jgi:hypothetical protein